MHVYKNYACIHETKYMLSYYFNKTVVAHSLGITDTQLIAI